MVYGENSGFIQGSQNTKANEAENDKTCIQELSSLNYSHWTNAQVVFNTSSTVHVRFFFLCMTILLYITGLWNVHDRCPVVNLYKIIQTTGLLCNIFGYVCIMPTHIMNMYPWSPIFAFLWCVYMELWWKVHRPTNMYCRHIHVHVHVAYTSRRTCTCRP